MTLSPSKSLLGRVHWRVRRSDCAVEASDVQPRTITAFDKRRARGEYMRETRTVTTPFLLWLSVQLVATSQGVATGSRLDPLATADSVVAAELRFFETWARAQVYSNRDNQKAAYPILSHWIIVQPVDKPEDAQPRWNGDRTVVVSLNAAAGCGFYGWAGPGLGTRVGGDAAHLPMCPHSLGIAVGGPEDQRWGWDATLSTSRRDTVRLARAGLIALLDSATALLPRNEFIVGQRVRFLVDQLDFAAARKAAGECRAGRSWCAMLLGYAIAREGDIRLADSVFRAALGAMSPAKRCRWSDIRSLLDSVSSREYERLTCEQRDSVNARFWWLADPLFSTPGNERRVEHFARMVLVALHSALTLDEFFDWRTDVAGNAVGEMLVRYGWPSLSGTASRTGAPGNAQDLILILRRENSADWVRSGDRSRVSEYLERQHDIRGPYASRYGYPKGRIHVAPALAALDNVFASRPVDWPVVADTERNAGWPSESYAPPRPILALSDAQTVLLRRSGGALLAVAIDLDAARLRRTPGQVIDGVALLESTAPDSMDEIARSSGVVGGTLRIRGLARSAPAIGAVEFPAGPTAMDAPAGRLRFGFTPPRSLDSMVSGEVAVSRPVILVGAGGVPLPLPADSLLERMAGSAVIGKGRSIGVYWETYGFSPDSNVDLGVWMQRATPQGLLREVGNLLGMTEDLNTPVVTTWRAPAAASAMIVSRGAVPVVARSVAVDMSHLAPGDYWLEVAAALPGRTPVRERTRIVIR